MKALLNTVLILFALLISAGCAPFGDWGMGGGGAPKPGGPRGGLEKKTERLSGPSHIPECYMRGRNLVMIYEEEKKYYELLLDDVEFDLRPRRHNSFSYTKFKELIDLETDGLIEVTSSPHRAWYKEDKEGFELSKSAPETLNRKSFNLYRFELSRYELANTDKWTSFLITDPEGFDRVIYIRTRQY